MKIILYLILVKNELPTYNNENTFRNRGQYVISAQNYGFTHLEI